MKNIYILGAAGSIGLQTLDLVRKHKKELNLVGISLGNNHALNEEILSTHKVSIVCLRSQEYMEKYQIEYPNTTFVHGDEGLLDLVRYPIKGAVVNALSGSAGLIPTIEAIKSRKDILLANKETLVMAGDIIKKLLNNYNVKLYPIDSEHSAIWQCLQNEVSDTVDKIVITASGGSFRDLSRNDLKHVRLEDALNHPNWSMGDKITIDSATMMNKGLEVIEAHYLFDLPYEKIETVLHKESAVHGLVYFQDGSIKACISSSDMRIPIQYALFYPHRMPYESKFVLTDLTFKQMDFKRYPLLSLAYKVGETGGLLPTVMNAANEAAVKLFLNQHISFLDIEKIVFDTVDSFNNNLYPTLEEIIQTDDIIQQSIFKHYGKR
ncbi:MAG: 1-deoxy-D-xylulose-5-phosphate reductoisomerase [Bacillota bacterium]|nr:MAG: 1-deoxy-D-xylulose-5-phosphate reductoisomerase [Bacillota bacterium]